jgi:hypothetical protein
MDVQATQLIQQFGEDEVTKAKNVVLQMPAEPEVEFSSKFSTPDLTLFYGEFPMTRLLCVGKRLLYPQPMEEQLSIIGNYTYCALRVVLELVPML